MDRIYREISLWEYLGNKKRRKHQKHNKIIKNGAKYTKIQRKREDKG